MSAFAQTEDYPVKKHSVMTNGFWENWFVSLGGGAQVQAAGRDEVGLFETLTPDFTVAVGKWWTPGLGLRLQTHFPSFKDADKDFKGSAFALYGEAMFNLTNMFCGYKQDRLYNAIPYIGFGRLWGDVKGWTPWALGYLSTFRLSDSWSIDLDLFLKQYNAIHSFKERNWQAGATVGLAWHIGGRGFDASPDMPAIAAMHAAQLAGLNDALSAEQDENKNLKEQLAQKPKEVIVEKIVKEVLAAPQSVFFSFNSAKIASKKEILNLESLANMAKNNGAKLKITGYADSATGVPAYNLQLSERRANAVAKELVKMGVPEENIVIEAKGGVSDITPASYNRRVIIQTM